MKLLNYYYCYHSYYYLSLYIYFFVWWRLAGLSWSSSGSSIHRPNPRLRSYQRFWKQWLYQSAVWERNNNRRRRRSSWCSVSCKEYTASWSSAIKVALGIGNWALARKLLFGGHSGKSLYCSVCPNDTKCPKQPLLNQLYR